jgi:hypothetical protein
MEAFHGDDASWATLSCQRKNKLMLPVGAPAGQGCFPPCVQSSVLTGGIMPTGESD